MAAVLAAPRDAAGAPRTSAGCLWHTARAVVAARARCPAVRGTCLVAVILVTACAPRDTCLVAVILVTASAPRVAHTSRLVAVCAPLRATARAHCLAVARAHPGSIRTHPAPSAPGGVCAAPTRGGP